MAIDYDALFGGDDYNPCDALKALRPVYMRLTVEGAGIQKVKFRDREVSYGTGDIKGLAALIRQLESECAALSGRRSQRAITAGYRPQPRRIF